MFRTNCPIMILPRRDEPGRGNEKPKDMIPMMSYKNNLEAPIDPPDCEPLEKTFCVEVKVEDEWFVCGSGFASREDAERACEYRHETFRIVEE